MRVRIENALLALLFVAGCGVFVALCFATKGAAMLLLAWLIVYYLVTRIRKDNT